MIHINAGTVQFDGLTFMELRVMFRFHRQGTSTADLTDRLKR
jgi:hypothetical protein